MSGALDLRLAIFCQSLASDWNHGNAHFLRGVVRELLARGARVTVYEPEDGWSLDQLVADEGEEPLRAFREAFPELEACRVFYDRETMAPERLLEGADLVLVHEWTDPDVVRRIGQHRARDDGYALLFHDTHHRAATAPHEMAAYDLSAFDGVLAFGEAIRRIYLREGWARRAWTWHEAADTRTFRPLEGVAPEGDLVWIGNWGDEERSAELRTFLLEPVAALGLEASVYGVRYPAPARAELERAGVAFRGRLPNHRVPCAFARHRVTVHVPRRPYAEALPGIPTIRPFEALACGIPLVCSPWRDEERLFRPGRDFLMARDGEEMRRHLRSVLEDEDLAGQLACSGRERIESRHTCAHRVDELLEIRAEVASA